MEPLSSRPYARQAHASLARRAYSEHGPYERNFRRARSQCSHRARTTPFVAIRWGIPVDTQTIERAYTAS